jgi:ligand-binding sensor domain-containing protein/signal transduction histidine kinase
MLAAGMALCRTGAAECRTNAFEEAKLTSVYRVRSWSTEDGLPQNTVLCLLQTHDGYLWFGTLDGLVRYDGLKLSVYDSSNVPFLNERAVLSLAECPEGRLWIGTSGGLLQYSNHCFSAVELGPRPTAVRSVCPCRDGGLWLGTELGPARVEAGRATIYTNYPGFVSMGGQPGDRGINSVVEGADGTVWFGDDRGLVRLSPRASQFEVVFASPGNLGGRFGGAGRVVCDNEGAIWFGNSAGLYRWQAGQLTLYPSAANGLEGLVEPLNWDAASGLWLSDGPWRLSRLHNGRFVHYRTQSGLSDGLVRCLQSDREGNHWVGTQFGGLSVLQPRKVVCLTTEQGLANDDVWSISQGADQSVWIGTADGVSRYANGRVVTNLQRSSQAPHFGFHAVLADRAGRLWAGTTANGLWKSEQGRCEQVFADLGGNTPLLGIQSLYQDLDGSLWIGAGSLLRLKEGKWLLWGQKAAGEQPDPVTIHPSVIGMLRDARGDLWIGTKGGLFRIRGGKLEGFTPTNGFPADIATPALADADGTVWFASSHGLIRYRGGRFFLISQAHGLSEALAYNVLQDDLGWLWLNGNRGLQRVSKQAANDVADGKTASLLCLHYGAAEGMLSPEGNGFTTPNSCKTRDGRLWFPTTKGAVIVDPRLLELSETPPPVLIEEVLADGEVILGGEMAQPEKPGAEAGTRGAGLKRGHQRALRLGPGRARSLLIRYSAPSFSAPERMRFEYQLEGYDAKWQTDSRSLRTAIYTNLRPGRYRFRLRACNAQGVSSAGEAQFAFSLAPFFYQTWPFYFLCGGIVLALAGSLHAVRMRGLRRIKELEQQQALGLERTRIARDMHDSLAADLTRIAMLAEMAQRQPGRAADPTQWAKAGNLARGLVDGIGELIWATNPRHNSLDSLAAYLRGYASEFLDAAGLRCHFDFPEEVPPLPISGEARRHLLLATKETLGNVAKHAHASEVLIHLDVGEGQVELTVEDDGCGFALFPGQDAGGASPSPRYSGGNGVRNIEERLRAIGGRCVIHSAPGSGTRVRMIIPLAFVPDEQDGH